MAIGHGTHINTRPADPHTAEWKYPAVAHHIAHGIAKGLQIHRLFKIGRIFKAEMRHGLSDTC